MLLITIITTSLVIIECINVITKSKLYEDFAQNIIYSIKKVVLENTYKLEYQTDLSQRQSNWEPTEAQTLARQQLDEVIRNLDLEISQKIRNRTYINDDPTVIFFFRTMKEFLTSNESQFNNYMYTVVRGWITAAFDSDSYNIVPRLINTSYKYAISNPTQNLEYFLNEYYGGSLPATESARILQSLYESIQFGLYDYSDFALSILRYSIIHVDHNVFSSVLKAVALSRNYLSKEFSTKIILAAFVYLYYLSFKEEETALNPIGDIKITDLPTLAIYESKINGVAAKFSLHDLAKQQGSLFTSFQKVFLLFTNGSIPWEFIPVGRAKWLRLEHDTIEFFAFYSICNFKARHIDSINNLTLDSLSQIFNYIDENGYLKKEHIKNYVVFYKWFTGNDLDNAVTINCKLLYSSLNQLIKRKLFEEVRTIKQEYAARARSLEKLKSEVAAKLKDSDLFLQNITENVTVYEFKHAELLQMIDWQNDQIIFNFDDSIKTIIEYTIYEKLSSVLNEEVLPRAYNNPNTLLKLFTDMLDKYDALGIHIDTSFNFDIVSELEYYDNAISDMNSLDYVKSRLLKRKTMAQSFAQTVYVDSSKATIGFNFVESSFMTSNENLNNNYFSEFISRFERDGRYLYSVDSHNIVLDFNKEELIEYLLASTFEVIFTANYIIPIENCGFKTTSIDEQE